MKDDIPDILFPIPPGAVLLPDDQPEGTSLRGLAIVALRRALEQRQLQKLPFGPEENPEDTSCLLQLNHFSIQLACTGLFNSHVGIERDCWLSQVTAPQLLLAAVVDEENLVVHFPGVLTAEEFVALASDADSSDTQISLSLSQFHGGIDRLLTVVELMEPDAVPSRALISQPADDWVPYIADDQALANSLAQAHPEPVFAEQVRQNSLAAAVLTRYLLSHDIAVDRKAANQTQELLQLQNLVADVVLPRLGKLEVLLLPAGKELGKEHSDVDDTRILVSLRPETLAYVVMELGDGGVWLHGVLLSSDLRQDCPEGGSILLTLMKPMSALMEAYGWWLRCQKITAEFNENHDWSMEKRAEVITVLNWLVKHVQEHERPWKLSKFLREGENDAIDSSVDDFLAVRGDTAPPSRTDATTDWHAIAMEWLEELGRGQQ